MRNVLQLFKIANERMLLLKINLKCGDHTHTKIVEMFLNEHNIKKKQSFVNDFLFIYFYIYINI